MGQIRVEGDMATFTRRWHVVQEVDLVRLVGAQRRRLDLCDALEAVAGALPTHPSAAVTEDLCARLIEAAVRNDADDLPAMRALLLHGCGDAFAVALLEHIRACHGIDEDVATEVAAALRSASRGAPSEILGALLRSFAARCRRSIDFEQLAMLLLAGPRMTADARALVVDALTTRVGH